MVALESLSSKYFNRFDSYDDIVKFWKMCFESAFFHRIFHFWTTLSNILDQVSPIPYLNYPLPTSHLPLIVLDIDMYKINNYQPEPSLKLVLTNLFFSKSNWQSTQICYKQMRTKHLIIKGTRKYCRYNLQGMVGIRISNLTCLK